MLTELNPELHSDLNPDALVVGLQKTDWLEERLLHVTFKDAVKLRHEAKKILDRTKKELPADNIVGQWLSRYSQACARFESRRQSVPKVSFPEALPISAKREEIAKIIDDNQVVILAGETGSGKTTQIPKLCLTLGRGVRGLIGHTQPRRIAASTVASRIAEELDSSLGEAVGYQVRFSDQTGDNTHIKLMTDGILLAEIQHDPLLFKYDTLIIDEAHERSLNIDFLLGYLKRILPKRPDLKLIVTSATIDLEKFSKHFESAPIIEVSGRTYPVSVNYRPWADEYEDIGASILAVVEEILETSKGKGGDILIFLSGERDIREISHELKKANLPHLDILPLYARLSLAEQKRVFQSHKGRRIVLSTNVAETSITVPGIRYVIDPGTARISRYSLRTKVQRLPIEAISQASANQRKGRCGRVSEGVCYRLYSEEDFESRPEYTDAEIVRTNLAAVILQMLQLRIGDIRHFPFVDKPDNRQISDGFKLLEELRAVDKSGKLSQIGRQLSKLPLDPKLARVVIEANKWGCVSEALVIASGLAIQDVRERPAEKRQASDEKHRRFWDEKSDFSSLLNLWNYAETQRQELSQNQFRRLCKKEFLNYLRLREWRDLHHQIKLAIKPLELKINQEPASYEAIHRSLVTGYVSNVGHKDPESKSREYLGTRNRKYHIFPGSSQNKKRPQWMVAAEFIETSQLFAHNVAGVDPKWILDSSEHLVKKNYFEPHFEEKSGQVKAFVRVSLLGLVLVEKQRVAYGKIDPDVAHEVFVRAALVEGRYKGKGDFFKRNQQLIKDVEELEAKSRRRDILVDEEVIFQFYKNIVPLHISNLAGFEHWRKQAEAETPDVLSLPKDLLMLRGAEDISVALFPDQISLGDSTFPVRYSFEPGKDNDGASLLVPVEMLHSLPENQLEWVVPGLLRDKCIGLVKSLPKRLRKIMVPVPQTIDRVMPRFKSSNTKLTAALAQELSVLTGAKVDAADWDESGIEDFYRFNIHVVDERGKMIDQSRHLSELRERYRDQVQKTIARVGDGIERKDILQWDFGKLEDKVSLDKGAVKITAYPSLIDEGKSVSIKVLDDPLSAAASNRRGLTRLAAMHLHETTKYLAKELLKGKDLGLAVVDLGRRDAVVDDIILAAVSDVVFPNDERPSTQSEFEALCQAGKPELINKAYEYEKLLIDTLAQIVNIKKTIKSNKNALALMFTFSDINMQVDSLVYRCFMFDTPLTWFRQYTRYFSAILQRLERAAQNPRKDQMAVDTLADLWKKHADRLASEGEAGYRLNRQWQDYRWMLEEFRVSLFAQSLKTLMPVSEKRLKRLWQESIDA